MKIMVIGGTGHIGTHLVPMLVGDGHEVVALSPGRTPIPQDNVWERVSVVVGDYGSENWAALIEEQKCEVWIDILGKNAPVTYDAIRPTCEHYILCGSIWMFGDPTMVPAPEKTHGPCARPGYAKRYAEMLSVQDRAAQEGIAFTAMMPPNICGPGKIPLDGRGGRDIEVHKSHQRGEPVYLPEPGNTLIGPCDAHDVARGFYLAAAQRDAANGYIFNVGAEYALTARQFIQTYADIYGCEIPIEWCSWQDYSENKNPEFRASYHFRAHMCPDLTRIKTQLGYKPRFRPEATMHRAVEWMKQMSLL